MEIIGDGFGGADMEYAVTLEDIPDSRFLEKTIQRMFELIEKSRTDHQLQNIARHMVRGCPHKDYVCFGDRVLSSVKKLITYTPDPKGIERLQDPWSSLHLRTADCDGYVVLLGSLFLALNFSIAMMTIKGDRDPKTGEIIDRESHVLLLASPPDSDKWYGVDGIVSESTFGWLPPDEYPRKIWEMP